MNLERAELREQLAGAYVVGTLRGPARRRFARACDTSQTLRTAVRRWEDQLMPLLGSLRPVIPSAGVWEGIARRTRAVTPSYRRLPWRWALAGTLALSLGTVIYYRVQQSPLQIVAAVGQDQLHPLWDVARSADAGTLKIRALRVVQSNPQSAYELWALPGEGTRPVSLGLLPRSGSVERRMSAPQRAALLRSQHIAVSLEPLGGSPTGNPTGPVLIVADVKQTG
jgi:anti-sigma-K factor RskA